MIKEVINKLVESEHLSFEEAKNVFEEIFSHKATSSQIAAFLTSLKIKGEIEAEISAAAMVVKAKAKKLNLRKGLLGIKNNTEPIIDTCGTGGSGLNKFNVSTATAFVVSALGVKVAKHGNKAMSSTCGSADVLEALGINIGVSSSVMEESIKRVGIGFLYAPLYHSALAEVAKVRREIGIRTIFNILGPLCNPAEVNYQLLGVYSRDLVPVIAKVLKRLGTKRAFVVNGKDVLDEVSLSGKTNVAFLDNKKIKNICLTPSSFGLKKIKIKDILVDNAKESARVIKNVLDGESGPAKDMVLANASACFYILGKASNLKQGVKIALELIDRGKAKDVYLKFKKFLEENA